MFMFHLKQRGFTLIEVLVVGSILSIIMAALFFSLTTGEFSISVASAKADLQAKVRLIMNWIVKDVRQTSLVEINATANAPSENHIKFRQVTGVNDTGSYTYNSNYTEYTYNETFGNLTRNEVNETGTVLCSLVFSNITQSPFYTAPGVPLNILNNRKLVIVINGTNQVTNSLTLNFNLTEEVNIRNP